MSFNVEKSTGRSQSFLWRLAMADWKNTAHESIIQILDTPPLRYGNAVGIQ